MATSPEMLQIENPQIKFTEPADIPPGIRDDDKHADLLKYLTMRLDLGKSKRQSRISRYARVDKMVSTWMRLSAEDAKRDEKEQQDGVPQAIRATIPILHTHVEDLTAFFAGVFSPNSRDFFQMSDPLLAEPMKNLVKKMNQDAANWQYYVQLVMSLRTILKYNISGFSIGWYDPPQSQDGENFYAPAGNQITAIDMYNYMWDPAVKDPQKIRSDAEWAAEFCVKNRYWVVKTGRDRGWWRLDKVVENDSNMNYPATVKRAANYYRYPPSDAGIGVMDDVGPNSQQQNLLDAYFAGLDSGANPEIYGHEIGYVYCRLNPAEFELLSEEAYQANKAAYDAGVYELWRFVVIDGTQIVHCEKVQSVKDEIPHYLGHLNVDEMGEASKSVAELLKAFQSFISFLFNMHVAGARSNIWGFIGINPNFYDTSALKPGDVAGVLTMKPSVAAANVNPATGIARIQGNSAETRQAMQDVANVMTLLQGLFPSQSMPSQVASIDRAVESQVAAVLQGVNRRIHMLAHLFDDQIMNPLRMAAYYNVGTKSTGESKTQYTGLDHAQALEALGSGLKQLNREAAAAAMQKIIFALIQSPDTITQNRLNLLQILDYWGDLMDVDMDLSQFATQQPAAQAAEGTQAGAEGSPAAVQA